MTVHALNTKAAIKGHPIHPMLVGFPIALYTAGLVSLIVYAIVRDPFWFRGAMTMWLAGAAIAALAAVFGLLDLFLGVPRSEQATRRTGIRHMGLNVASLILFAAGGFMLLDTWQRAFDVTQMEVVFPITIGAVGLALTAAAGFLGWKLVQVHHVGITETSEASSVTQRTTVTPPSVPAPLPPKSNQPTPTMPHN